MGDSTGYSHVDEIYPASYCDPYHAIECDGGAPNYWVVTMAWVPADAQWEICGDDCSISVGNGDVIVGWSNRDRIFGGGGDDDIYGQGGSDCIFGDDGHDWIEGGSCNVADDEYLWGGIGNDVVTNNTGNCARFVLGSHGNDVPLKGGAGPDYIYGGTGNDRLYGGEGTDYCNGEQESTQDWCEPSPGCDVRVSCEAP